MTKIKNKEERMKSIRKDDEELLKCMEPYKESEKDYYLPGKLGIETKILLEKKAPSLVKKLLGEEYVGKN